MHPDMRWVEDHLRFRCVCVGWVERAAEGWLIRAGHKRAIVRMKDKATRWLERWAAHQVIRRKTPTPRKGMR